MKDETIIEVLLRQNKHLRRMNYLQTAVIALLTIEVIIFSFGCGKSVSKEIKHLKTKYSSQRTHGNSYNSNNHISYVPLPFRNESPSAQSDPDLEQGIICTVIKLPDNFDVPLSFHSIHEVMYVYCSLLRVPVCSNRFVDGLSVIKDIKIVNIRLNMQRKSAC